MLVTKITELKNQLSSENQLNFTTIDAYARTLSVRGGSEDQLNDIKKVIGMLFLFLQNVFYKSHYSKEKVNKVSHSDRRYVEFYDARTDKDLFHVITWNYDSQIEFLGHPFIQEKKETPP